MKIRTVENPVYSSLWNGMYNVDSQTRTNKFHSKTIELKRHEPHGKQAIR